MKNVLWPTASFGLLFAVAYVGCAESDEKSNDADKATFASNHLCQQLHGLAKEHTNYYWLITRSVLYLEVCADLPTESIAHCGKKLNIQNPVLRKPSKPQLAIMRLNSAKGHRVVWFVVYDMWPNGGKKIRRLQ
nr:uncharacterized protein LOC126529393 isoform X2 [Dermacentor andersoni]